MSAYRPDNWLDGLYVGSPVMWCQRHEDGLMPVGRVFGFIWDTKDNGAIIEFDQDEKFRVHFFVPWSGLKDWHDEITFIHQALFVGLVERREYRMDNWVRGYGSIRRNRRRVPVWTQYY